MHAPSALPATVVALAAGLVGYAVWLLNRNLRDGSGNTRLAATTRGRRQRTPPPVQTLLDCIGNTPLLEIPSLSRATGCTILGKAEFLNPSATSKDRIALGLIEKAERDGLLRSGMRVFEGTVGSTGIALALVCRAKGYDITICMPDDQAKEKYAILVALGVDVVKTRPAPIVHPTHFVNTAQRLAAETGGFFVDQFENLANFDIHYETTGPEIWTQSGGNIDAFVMGAGTGGTLAGAGLYLKERSEGHVRVVLADPQGSGLYNKVKHGVLFTSEEREGHRRRHQVDTVVEGIGQTRLTANIARALAVADDAERVTDDEAVAMSRRVLRDDGLFVGSSTAVNLVAAERVARALGPGHVVVTVLCDNGQRHTTKFWNDDYLADAGIAGRGKGKGNGGH